MANIMISPGKYVQGKGELQHLGTYVAPLGKKALAIISESGYKRSGEIVDASLKESKVEVVYAYFNGECSKAEIERIKGLVKENRADIVLGIGGGKILDTAKAVAYYEKVPVVICPTIASTDAPCSALSVIYTEEGVFDEYLFLPSNPNVVIIDTDVIVKSPARLTIAGMGDALATYFEARACKASNATSCAGGTITTAAMGLSELCYDTLMTEGLKAKLALEAGVFNEAVDKVIEANTLLSGIGFESGGLAGAHAIHNGLTVMKECDHLYHGEKVAFGTICQLVLENADEDELFEVIGFCIDMGLPVTLGDMGVEEIEPDKIMAVAQAAASEDDTIHNMPFTVTAEDVYAAILTADAMGKYLKGDL